MTRSKKTPAKKAPTKASQVKIIKPQSKGKKKEAREKILAAARNVFSNYPYHSATIRMIGKLAEIEHPLISYYFPNKADLFTSVLEGTLENLHQGEKQWLEEVKSIPAARGLSIYLDNQLDFFRLNPEAFHIIALNTIQSEDNEPIPGYELIEKSVARSVKTFKETVNLAAPEYEVEMFCRVFSNLLITFLGASKFHAASVNMDPKSIQYYNWVKECAIYTLLPRLELMGRRADSKS